MHALRRPPFRDACFDNVLVYGVLHHLPDPKATCREIVRLLRPGGVYLGCENNRTVVRKAFDAVQRLRPLWYEEAGSHPVMSAADSAEWFSGTGLVLTPHTKVFLPPHLANWLGFERGRRWLRVMDQLAKKTPFVRSNGGLLMISGVKPLQPPAGLVELGA